MHLQLIYAWHHSSSTSDSLVKVHLHSIPYPESGWESREKGIMAPVEGYIWTVRNSNSIGDEQFEIGNVAWLQ